jgi:hypothetical protein
MTTRVRVRKPNGSIYGLKQASRQWHKKLKEELGKLSFVRASYDPALFVDKQTHTIFKFIWVDAIFIVSEEANTNCVIDSILTVFQGRDPGEASWLLGMEVAHNHKRHVLQMSQRRMIENMVERFGITIKTPNATPMETGQDIGLE